MIEFEYGDLTFEFSPNGALTAGELQVFKAQGEPFGGRIDLSNLNKRDKLAETAAQLYPDTFDDVDDLKRGLAQLYATLQEKARMAEAEKAKEEEDDTAGVEEEEIEALVGRPGVLDRYVEDMAEVGAVHEDRQYMRTVALGGFSAQLDLSFNKPLGTNVVLTGESGRGKNYVPDAVAKGMPDEFVYEFESASAKSFYYQADADPDRFRHTWVYPNEAEAVDSLIETLRPLLSKGSAEHGTVDGTTDGTNEFRSLRVHGPITVTIPTVRNKLDGQLQTRLLTVEMEDYEGRVAGHTEKFADTLLPDYVAADHTSKLEKWKVALKTLTNIRKVVLPGKVEGFRYDNDNVSHGARVWRNLLSFMLTHAWLEQRNRETIELGNGEKAIVVKAEDYRVAYELFKEVATRSVINLSETHKKICDAVYALQDSKSSSRLHGKGFSIREIAEQAEINHQTVQKHKTFLIASEGLLREGEKGGLMLVEGADPSWWHKSDLLKGLPNPDDVEKWWSELQKGVDTVDSDEKLAEKPIDKPNEASTPTVDTSTVTDRWTDDERDRKRRLEAGETLPINMSRAKNAPHKNLLEWAVRTGRFVRADRKTKWGNPHEMEAKTEAERDRVIEDFKQDLRTDSILRAGAHIELSRGKALGCWCAPKPCHCDVLAEIANSNVDASTQVSTPTVDSKKPINKPNEGEKGDVSTVSTPSTNGQENKTELRSEDGELGSYTTNSD